VWSVGTKRLYLHSTRWSGHGARATGAFRRNHIGSGFYHHDTEPGSDGIGFAATSPHDTLPPGPDATSHGHRLPADHRGAVGSRAGGLGGRLLTGTANLTMPMSTWLGLTRAFRAGHRQGVQRPLRETGAVASLGPFDAEKCRQFGDAMDSATCWCLTLTDPAGQAVAHA
jgi:hypothetical protein